MIERVKPREEPKAADGGLYFKPTKYTFLHSGCTLLNLILSGRGKDGGWPVGRVINIVGDKSTGKTLLAEEAMAIFNRKYPTGKVYYRESEAAFDAEYAEDLGLDTSKIDFGPDGEDSHWETVEDVFEDLEAVIEKIEGNWRVKAKALQERNKKLKLTDALKQVQTAQLPSLYIIDSLDALTDKAELKRELDEGSYGTDKAKLMSKLFRKLVRRLREAKICLIVISQTRDRIGAMIRGVKYTRSGGKALDFYTSIIIYLSEIEKLNKTVNGKKHITGICVRAKCTKNKITTPHKECVFSIRFGYGVDDVMTTLDYLESEKCLEEAGYTKRPTEITDEEVERLQGKAVVIWHDIQKQIKPAKGKYAA